MNKAEQQAITAIRVIAAEAIDKANSGHPGKAIGSAPAVYTLWKQMKHNPKNPAWQARDRFVLSAGHASMLEYALLHFFGYGLTMDDIKNFRQFGSLTPGHPEYGHTRGVEATTGPLGQGFAMAVGMAMAEAHLAAKYNRDGFPVVDNFTYTVAGDGCMMEGVASEAASLAGTLKLGKLIAMYDSNQITIEGGTDLAFREDVGARFVAYGWQVLEVADGEDTAAVAAAIAEAKADTTRPSLIIYHTIIARGTPVAGTPKAHGSPLGPANIAVLKQTYGWPNADAFDVPPEVYDHYAQITAHCAQAEADWNALFADYAAAYPELAAQWKQDFSSELPVDLLHDEAFWAFEGKAASRSSSGEVLNRLAARLPNLFGGSADLAPSNCTNLKGLGSFSAENYAGQNLHFGVREFAMAAACNGIALYGGLRTFCATFFVFSDYLKPALRLTALMGLPVIYVLTHDSIGVGEDGPTHQPIEQLAMLRAVPNCLTFRPADAREVAAAYVAALDHKGPTVLALSRQNLPLYEKSGPDALRGGYILREPKGKPDVILMASGSEVEVLFGAADILSVQGCTARIVSMPCMELFNAQDEAYRQSVLPNDIRARVAVEAGSAFGWHRYVGLDGKVVAMEGWGASAPAELLFEHFGFTAENVAKVALEVIKAE
ncbi:MAG: transketolase [Clostridiales bacterium]|nr:transketolase [Clostridiales bacterium]